jgi:hypothetical protein
LFDEDVRLDEGEVRDIAQGRRKKRKNEDPFLC